MVNRFDTTAISMEPGQSPVIGPGGAIAANIPHSPRRSLQILRELARVGGGVSPRNASLPIDGQAPGRRILLGRLIAVAGGLLIPRVATGSVAYGHGLLWRLDRS